MRTPKEQDEFLERGRFGKGDRSFRATRIDTVVWLGMLFIAAGLILFSLPWLSESARAAHGGLLFLIGARLSGGVGVVVCIVGFIRMKFRGR
jgi:hypothetical protein